MRPLTASGWLPGPKEQAGSPAEPSGHLSTASWLIKPIAGSAGEWSRKPFAVIRGNGLWEPPCGNPEAILFAGVEYFSGVSICKCEQRAR